MKGINKLIKRKLSFEEQIEDLKSKNVKFEIYSEDLF